MLLWLNGRFVNRAEARVSVFDAGFQHGVGLFETMLARHGAAFRAQAHLERLQSSARELLLSDRLRADPLVEAVNLTLQRNNLVEARVRLTITGGDLSALGPGPRAGSAPSAGATPGNGAKNRVDPTILIVAQPPPIYPEAFFAQGVRATIADGRENPFNPMAGHKTLNYWPRIAALQHAAAKRAGEAIWFTVSNHLASGCVSNIFLVKDGALHTPIARGEEEPGALRAPVLPGITRAAILELADTLELETHKRMLDINDLLGADEVFLTNSSWGVLPVTAVEKERIGPETNAGKVGPITQQLRHAWLALVEQETAAEAM